LPPKPRHEQQLPARGGGGSQAYSEAAHAKAGSCSRQEYRHCKGSPGRPGRWSPGRSPRGSQGRGQSSPTRRKANRMDRRAIGVPETVASQEDLWQGRHTWRPGRENTGVLALAEMRLAWLAWGTGAGGSGRWRVSWATRRRKAAATAPAGRRRARIAVGPGRASRGRPRRAGRPASAARVPG
jgi:hypothetical protein